ncbi:hypothetical protein FBZ83_101332 [Azospirillum brasilense]|uniref:Uncharacterized protein n=1 Tax=Azospirillum brasilense TaxID=192 RepID=A0A560CRI3_AZOBR|nr:hypothetical protein FBZ83_101332 [Azospirillum brasilense]
MAVRCGTIASALLMAACANLSPPPQAAPEPGAVSALNRLSSNSCNPVVASSLAGVRIPVSEVRYLAYGLYRDIRRGEIVGYDAWMGLNSQPGAVVVQLDALCAPQQIYARGGARLPDAR